MAGAAGLKIPDWIGGVFHVYINNCHLPLIPMPYLFTYTLTIFVGNTYVVHRYRKRVVNFVGRVPS